MPKHGFLAPKAIANRIKAKGLQKLRWYCQMCQKQCRDENGFKCHTMSESHQRQLLLFADNPDKYIDQFSQEFLDCFVKLLKRRFGTRRVHANQVYQEYIADREHLHMNSTQWETLTDFVKWLGREGHCVVDETEKGWFISWIDRDPETIRRQEVLAKQEKMKLDDEERMHQLFERQMQKDKETSKPQPKVEYTELKKENEDEKIAFAMKPVKIEKKVTIDVKNNPLSATLKTSVRDSTKNSVGEKRKLALEEIIEQEKAAMEKKNRKDYWLTPGIVVKLMTHKYGKELYKKKAVIQEVKNRYEAVVKIIDCDEKLDVKQDDVETVIPTVGRKVLILNGLYRHNEAKILDVNFDTFSVKVRLVSGSFKGKTIDNVKYEDISKLYVQS
ncbi:DNA/RNA-binding protein KIN17 [Parasteatoda tepidariorum]|nr:DNA/RNA-binding protein KIN17 [Parasteatoda tepidariorum]